MTSLIQLEKWTWTTEAAAPCLISDVMDLTKMENSELWWLGPVPCRRVRIYGHIIGIRTEEYGICYRVEDESDVIDCQTTHLEPRKLLGSLVEVVGFVEDLNGSRRIYIKRRFGRIRACSYVHQSNHQVEVAMLRITQYDREGPFHVPIEDLLLTYEDDSQATLPCLPHPYTYSEDKLTRKLFVKHLVFFLERCYKTRSDAIVLTLSSLRKVPSLAYLACVVNQATERRLPFTFKTSPSVRIKSLFYTGMIELDRMGCLLPSNGPPTDLASLDVSDIWGLHMDLDYIFEVEDGVRVEETEQEVAFMFIPRRYLEAAVQRAINSINKRDIKMKTLARLTHGAVNIAILKYLKKKGNPQLDIGLIDGALKWLEKCGRVAHTDDRFQTWSLVPNVISC